MATMKQSLSEPLEEASFVFEARSVSPWRVSVSTKQADTIWQRLGARFEGCSELNAPADKLWNHTLNF